MLNLISPKIVFITLGLIVNLFYFLFLLSPYHKKVKIFFLVLSNYFILIFFLTSSKNESIWKFVSFLLIIWVFSASIVKLKRMFFNLKTNILKTNNLNKELNTQSLKRTYISSKPYLSTSFGLKVRSKSELIIAEKLFEKKIKFQYEQLLSAENKTYYPDFTVQIGKQIFYWEHFGMMNDEEYAIRAKLKMAWYKKNFPGKLVWTVEDPQFVIHINQIISKLKNN